MNIDQGGCNEKKYVRESIARFRKFSIEKKSKMVKDGCDNSCVSGGIYHASCYHDKF